METRNYLVYKFGELSEKQQEKVVENYCDINVDYPFWQDDEGYDTIAQEYGIKIGMGEVQFDFDRGNYIAFDTYNHGRNPKWKCPIEITEPKKFCKKARVKYNPDNTLDIDHNHYAGGRIANTISAPEYTNEEENKLQNTLNEMFNEILTSLRKDYDYLTSREAIVETLLANDYDFTTGGKIDKKD